MHGDPALGDVPGYPLPLLGIAALGQPDVEVIQAGDDHRDNRCRRPLLFGLRGRSQRFGRQPSREQSSQSLGQGGGAGLAEA